MPSSNSFFCSFAINHLRATPLTKYVSLLMRHLPKREKERAKNLHRPIERATSPIDWLLFLLANSFTAWLPDGAGVHKKKKEKHRLPWCEQMGGITCCKDAQITEEGLLAVTRQHNEKRRE